LSDRRFCERVSARLTYSHTYLSFRIG
jgi:hypothetical protein